MSPDVTSRLNFGAILTGVSTAREVTATARRIEDAGYDGVWVTDGGVRADTLPLLATAAGACDLEIGTAVLLLPLRHPTLVARTTATLDNLSEGRLVLGIGVGGERKPDFDAYGYAPSQRGRRTDEALEIITQLWAGDNVTFEGRYWQVESTTLQQLPVQRPGPPILVGGRIGGQGASSDAALKRTARWGQGWLPYLISPDQYAVGIERLDGYAREQNRDPATLDHAILQFICVHDDKDEARSIAAANLQRSYGQDFSQIVDRFAVFGPVEDCVARLAEYARAGVRRFIFNWCCNREDVAINLDRVGREIMPALREAIGAVPSGRQAPA